MQQRLKLSLLSQANAAKLKLTPHIEGHSLLVNPQWAGFKIPYFTLTGKATDFFRFRYLQYKPTTGFAALADDPVKPLRYNQPKDSGIHIYFCPLVPWQKVVKEKSIPICITEGELKAACACSAGIPTIGLGGVFNWRSAKRGEAFVSELEQVIWKDRLVYVAFDSDSATNPMVTTAISMLAAELISRGAMLHRVEIPPSKDGAKQGLDDYALVSGLPSLEPFILSAEEDASSKELHQFNLDLAFIRTTSEAIEVNTGLVWSTQKFTEGVYKNHWYHAKVATKKGVTLEKRYVAKEWLEWPQRRTVRTLTYAPGEPQLTREGDYNTWSGYALEPNTKGDVKPWLDLLGKLMGDADGLLVDWLKCWFAYPLQYPGTKLYSAVLFWGAATGSGKTLLGETMQRIYGRNYASINNADLEGTYNSWAAEHQFVVGNEISLSGSKRTMADNMKDIITRTHVTINQKYRAHYTVRDLNNFYFTSNHPDAFFLEDHDRRFFVQEAAMHRAMPDDYYTRYVNWLDNQGGAARLFHYFLHEVDCSTFNPKAKAPDTPSKLQMIMDGKSDLADWVLRIRAEPDLLLIRPHDLWTNQDLLKLYDPEQTKRVTANGLSREMKAAGFRYVAHGNNTGLVDGVRSRFWALRNSDKYRRMGPAQIATAYAEERLKYDKRAKFDAARQGRVN